MRSITNRPAAFLSARCMLAVILVVLAGCATRPSAEVLKPVDIAPASAEPVSVIAVTNRKPEDNGIGFSNAWAADVTYERYDLSVPKSRDGTTIRYPMPRPDPDRQYVVTKRGSIHRAELVREATSSPTFDGTVGIFVHGYNYSYQEALFRTAQVAADAKITSPPILFSWPSAASITGYVADRDAVLYSRSELLGLLTAFQSPKVKRVVLFGHSMGGFLTMEVVRQLRLSGHDALLRKLIIVLAAPDIDLDVFRSQLSDIGQMTTPITLLVAKVDRALLASSLIAQERPRIGQLDVNDPMIGQLATEDQLRIVDITSVQGSDGLGHDRYAAFAQYVSQLDAFEQRRGSGAGEAGAFVFDAAGLVVSSPFRLVGKVIGGAR